MSARTAMLAVAGAALLAAGLLVGVLVAGRSPGQTSPPSVCRAVVTAARYVAGADEAVRLAREYITVSSVNREDQSGANLVDGNRDTFWHIKFPPDGSPVFITIDLPEDSAIAMIRILPRLTHRDQMWDGRAALWQASEDRRTWRTLAALQVERERLNDGEWISFLLPPSPAFRTYRLEVRDPKFLSLAEIALVRRLRGDVVAFDLARGAICAPGIF